jgi:hypothetical protein
MIDIDRYLYPITDDKRLAVGHQILPEVREDIKKQISRYITACGCVRILKIAEALDVNYLTARELVNEVLDKWKENDIEPINAQIKWVEEQLEIIESKKDTKTITDNEGKSTIQLGMPYAEYISLKTTLMKQLNDLRMLADGSSADKNEVLAFHLFGKIKPKTIQSIRQDNEPGS